MNKIIVVSGARGIGDLIYQLPLLRSLYLTYKTKLILISNEVNKSKEVYKYEDFYSEIINFDNTRYSIFKTFTKIKSFLNLLNNYAPDLLILTSNATRLMLPVYLSNAKKKIIFGTKNFLLIKDKTNNHFTNCEKLITYTKNLDLKIKNNSFFLSFPKIESIEKNIDDNKIFISIDSHHDQNNWSIENFIKITKILIKQNKKIFFNFSPNKKYFLDKIPELIKCDNNCTFVYQKSITELIEIINSCSVIIGNESGPICLGASLKKKVHSIYIPIHTKPESQVIGGNVTYYNTDLLKDDEIIKNILKTII
jgi:ADP-heptose:LPS heptosyltransferase